MSRLFLRGLHRLADNRRRLSATYAEDPDNDTCNDERNAEHMAHVDHHVAYLEEGYRRGLGEFQKEAATETEGEEDAKTKED